MIVNIDNTNLDSDLIRGSFEKKVNLKEEVKNVSAQNDDFWLDCVNQETKEDKQNIFENIEDKMLNNNASTIKDSIYNLSNIGSESVHEHSPKTQTKNIDRPKISCKKCSMKEEKKRFNNSFSNDSNNTYIFSQNKEFNNLNKYKQSLIKGQKFKPHNRSASEGNSYANSYVVTEANFDKGRTNKNSLKSVDDHQSMNERVKNSSLIDLKKKNSELETKINKINKSKTNHLYLSSLRNKEKKEFILKEYEKQKTENELKDCTFKPKLNNNYQTKKKNLVISSKLTDNINIELKNPKTVMDSGFFERGNAWQNRKNEKFENFKNYLVKQENKICTFQPEIRKKSLPNYEKAELDINSLKYLERQNKAKQEKQEKIDKLNPNISKMFDKTDEIYDKVFKKQRISSNYKGIQKEEEYCTFNPNKKNTELEFVKTLRNQLHAIDLNEIKE